MLKRLTPVLVLLALSVSLLVAGPAMAEEPFGLQSLDVSAVNQNGSADVQAGSHPYALKTSFYVSKPEMSEVVETGQKVFRARGGGLKDVRAELPPGFVGNPNATPKCSYQAFAIKQCPNDTAVGEAVTTLSQGHGSQLDENNVETHTFNDPLYNVEPPGGVPSEFGYIIAGTTIFLDASVRTGSDYGITVNVRNVPQTISVYGSTITIWGVPADPSHNNIRGDCLTEGQTTSLQEEEEGIPHNEETSNGDCPVDVPVEPLLTNPTSCGVPRSATFSVDDWADPEVFVSTTATLPELSGCEKLDFSP